MLERVLIAKATEVLVEGTRHFARSTGPWAVEQALGSLLGKALYPFAEG
jgi:hypothetical protein